MFKARFLFVVNFLIVLINAAPIDKDSEAKIINNDFNIDEKGNYNFSFKTSNGLTREETGFIVNEGQSDEHIELVGSYTYFDTEGQEVMVEYSAGNNGYNILPPRPLAEKTVFSSPPHLVASLLGK